MKLNRNHKRALLLGSTTVLTMAMMVTRVFFAINANKNIADNTAACGASSGAASASTSAYDYNMAIASASLFAANTLFATISRTYAILNQRFYANRLLAKDKYLLSRFLRQQKSEAEWLTILVENNEIKQDAEQYLAELKYQNSSLSIQALSEYRSERNIQADEGKVFSIALQKSKMPTTATAIAETKGDKVMQYAAYLLLFITNLLRFFFALYSSDQATTSLVGRIFLYVLAVAQAPLQFFFRSADSALLAIKLKDQFQQPGERKTASLKVLVSVAVAYFAQPYGLYFSSTMLGGNEKYFNHISKTKEACHYLNTFAQPLLWIAATTFALPAVEYLWYFFSKPLQHLRHWFKQTGVLFPLLFSLGAADSFYSAYYYPKDLLTDDMPDASNVFINFLLTAYVVVYSLYYIFGNIEGVGAIINPKAKPSVFNRCCFFASSASYRENAAEQQKLFTEGDNMPTYGSSTNA